MLRSTFRSGSMRAKPNEPSRFLMHSMSTTKSMMSMRCQRRVMLRPAEGDGPYRGGNHADGAQRSEKVGRDCRGVDFSLHVRGVWRWALLRFVSTSAGSSC